TSFHVCRCPADTRLKEGNCSLITKTGGMLPLPRVGDALLAHCRNCIRLHRACQSIPRSFPPSSSGECGWRKLALARSRTPFLDNIHVAADRCTDLLRVL